MAAWLYAPSPWWVLALLGLVLLAAALPWPRRRRQMSDRPQVDAAALVRLGFGRPQVRIVEPPRQGEWE